MPKAVLPLFYAPPLPFFVAVYGMEEWHFDAKEHFVKLRPPTEIGQVLQGQMEPYP